MGLGRKIMRLQGFLIILILVSGCREGVKGPLSINQILDIDVHLPVYYVGSDFNAVYKDLDTTYYYFSDPPELRLDTYFTIENSEGKKVRLARMSTFNLSGQLVDIDETKNATLSIQPPVNFTGSKTIKLGFTPSFYYDYNLTGNTYYTVINVYYHP